jgi:biopolymer transport protein ExbD
VNKKKKKRAKRRAVKYRDVELNIMPFIDVFSLLNTFLLMSAVFLAIGVIEVQIPFLTSAPPTKTPPENDCDIKVDMTKDKIEASAENCKGVDPKKEFEVSKAGMSELHKHMVQIRRNNPDHDKLQFFSDDDVIWEDMAAALDSIKLRQPGDPLFQGVGETEQAKAESAEFVFPKVVLASVML